MTRYSRYTGWFVGLLAGVVLAGCGVTSIMVPVTRPAEINLGKVKRIAIGTIQGELGGEVEDDLISRLLEIDSFEVLDRANIDQILRELRLSSSDLIDEKSALKMGQLLGVAALVTGRVSEYKYDEATVQGKPYTDKQNVTHTPYTREGRASVTVNFRITDLSTGKFLYAKALSAYEAGKTQAVDSRPVPIDGDQLLKMARRKVVGQFIKKIAPHREYVNVILLSDSDLPMLESGIALAKAGDWDGAIGIFREATERYNGTPIVHKAFYNLGVAYEYSARFPEAMEALRKAYQLERDSRYVQEIESCRRREAEHKKLIEQLESE
jgi:tetratricopeptide (TPR) repeat protein